MNRILDRYYKYPIIIDLLIASVICLCNTYYPLFSVSNSTDTLRSITSNLIDASVSLAGFVLAALTIIVTFKSNLKAKKIEDAENPIEIILSSKNYGYIVKTFKGTILELCILFILLYCLWFLFDSIDMISQFNGVIVGITILGLSLFRSIALLFKLLSIEGNNTAS